jgi:predicted dehydrogenase
MADRFRVTAVYDQVARRAGVEAASLRCAACEGLDALIGRPDVDVVYLLTPQWFGLHPVALACAHGKPVYCALPIAGDPAGLEELAGAIRASGISFMPELARRFYPATLRLRELLATRLGRPRLVLGHSRLFGFDRYGQPGPATQITPAPLTIDPGSYLIDWCRFLFQGEPVALQGFGGTALPAAVEGGASADFESIALEFADGEMVQVTCSRFHRTPWGEATRFLPPPGFQVYAERGVAWVEPPDRIQWTDADGPHEERLPLEPTVGEVLNDQFHRLVRGDQSLAPTLRDALAVTRLVADLHRSRREGRKVAPTVVDESD